MQASVDAGRRPIDYPLLLQQAAEQAGETAGWVEHDLEIGPRRVRLRFAGQALVPFLLDALHPVVRPPDGAADTTISIWDTASTGVAGPEQGWRGDEVLGRTAVKGLAGVAQDPGSGIVSVFDDEARSGVFWAPAAERIRWYDRAAPLRALLNWALAGPTSRLVHAGAVGRDRGGALLVGPGGSGKSTLALACLRAGLGYVGDDYVFLVADGGPVAHALYGTAKADDRTLDLVGGLRRAFPPQGADGEKAVLRVDPVRPSAPLTAVVLPSLGAGGPELEPVSGAEALRALAPSTIFQLPPTAVPLAPLGELVRSVPSYRLALGPDPAAAASLVEELLA